MGRHNLREDNTPTVPSDCYDEVDGWMMRHHATGHAGHGTYTTVCGRIGLPLPENFDDALTLDCVYCYPPTETQNRIQLCTATARQPQEVYRWPGRRSNRRI